MPHAEKRQARDANQIGEARVREQRGRRDEAVLDDAVPERGAREDARYREQVRQRIDVLAHGFWELDVAQLLERLHGREPLPGLGGLAGIFNEAGPVGVEVPRRESWCRERDGEAEMVGSL